MELNDILATAFKAGASDIHFKAGLPALFRIHGTLMPFKEGPRHGPEDLSRMALSIMNNFQREKFKQTNELDLSYGVPGLGRFRVNVFQQRGTIAIVFRVIPFKIRSVEELQLPKVLTEIATEQRGMILVTGTTGSGKSTTLAAMIDYINTSDNGHIITIEDPIEFLHRDKNCIVNQREVGVDTASFGAALKSALRQDPDVILVGEMRDLETTGTAITAAETGHLVLSTLHTLDATETISRIVSIFPPHQQKQVRMQLGAVLRAVISQRLVPTKDGKGRAVAMEIMRNTARVRELIEDKDRTKELVDAIAQGATTYGMMTFDQSLMALYKAGRVSFEEAQLNSSNPSNFALRVRGIEGTSDSQWQNFEGGDKKGEKAPAAAPAKPQTQGVRPAQTQVRQAPKPDDDLPIDRF